MVVNYAGTSEEWANLVAVYTTVFSSDVTIKCTDNKEIRAFGTCGENVRWTLETNGTLTISGEGAMMSGHHGRQALPWYSFRNSVKSFVIEDGVTSISDSACSSDYLNLTSVSIGKDVSEIGQYAFWGCKSLTSITIPESVTKIGNNAFTGCAKEFTIRNRKR